MKKVFAYIFFYFILITGNGQLVSEVKTATSFPLSNAVIYVDDFSGVEPSYPVPTETKK